MVLFEVNKFKKYPQNKKKHHKWVDIVPTLCPLCPHLSTITALWAKCIQNTLIYIFTQNATNKDVYTYSQVFLSVQKMLQ